MPQSRSSPPASSQPRKLRDPSEIAAALEAESPDRVLAGISAISATSGWISAEWQSGLDRLLAHPSLEVRTRAAEAISRMCPPAGVLPLIRLLSDDRQPGSVRKLASRGLAMQGTREAAGALVAHCSSPDASVAQASVDALASLTTDDVRDAASALAWWEQKRHLTGEAWAAMMLPRWQERAAMREVEAADLRGRLISDRRAEWLRSAEPRRSELLAQHLNDNLAAIRLLGLELLQSRREPESTVDPAVRQAVRMLLDDRDPAVQLASVRAIAGLRDRADAELLLARLRTQPAPSMQAALVNALGYVGGPEVFGALIAQLDSPSREVQFEAANAIGRLAERDQLSWPLREQAASVLSTLWDQCPRDSLLRERAIWALGSLAIPAARPRCIAALAPGEPTNVRQSAAAALAAIGDSESCAALRLACRDPDVTVRRSAIENYAQTAATPEQAECLWHASWASTEADAAVRQLAWSAIVRGLEKKPWADIRPILEKLPTDDPSTIARCDELARLALTTLPPANGDAALRFEVRRVQAGVCRAAGNSTALRSALLAAIEELDGSAAALGDDTAGELLQAALASASYDFEVHAALRSVWPASDVLWDRVRRAVESFVEADQTRAAPVANMLRDQIDASTPAEFAAWIRSRTAGEGEAGVSENPSSQPVTRRDRGPSAG